MRTNLAKLSTFASVLFLSLVIAGCGGKRSDGNGMQSMSPGGEGGEHGSRTPVACRAADPDGPRWPATAG